MTQKKGSYIVLRAPKELIQEARRKAREQDRPLSQIVRELLRGWLAEHSQPVQVLK